jgi:hypothetical protein
MVRRLNEEQEQFKEVVLELARTAFHNNAVLFNEFSEVSDWRLARIGEDVQMNGKSLVFRRGDITVCKKMGFSASIPKVSAFSWRTKKELVLNQTDPIEFLED